MKLGTLKPSLYVKLTRLTLTGKSGDKEYLLTWSFKNRYFSIAVTDPKTNKNLNNLKVVMNETILRTLTKFMRKLIDKKEEVSYSLTSKSIDFDNKDSNTLLVRGKIIIGKKKVGDELINYLTMTNNDESVKITFPFIPNKYYVFSKNGKEITKTEELSNIYLDSYADIIEDLIITLPKFTEADIFDTAESSKKFNKPKPRQEAVSENSDFDDELF